MSASLRMVVTGTTGKIARSLCQRVAADGVEVVAVGRPSFDLARPDSIAPVIRAARPDVLVSAAGYTTVEQAETEPELANAINVRGAQALAECARDLGIPIIHLSSAYVFDGLQPTPYREHDPARPVGSYGRSKLMGERAVAQAHPQHVILRLSWVYSPFGRNFVTAMLRQAERDSEVRVVKDQTGNPTAATEIADSIVAIGRRLASGGLPPDRYGIFHLAAPCLLTPAAFATRIFDLSAACHGPTAKVAPIPQAEYVSGFRRPANIALDSSKIADTYGIPLPSLDVPLRACIEQILEQRT
jgi:dTDP-4-dehydrorhamnose reductase